MKIKVIFPAIATIDVDSKYSLLEKDETWTVELANELSDYIEKNVERGKIKLTLSKEPSAIISENGFNIY